MMMSTARIWRAVYPAFARVQLEASFGAAGSAFARVQLEASFGAAGSAFARGTPAALRAMMGKRTQSRAATRRAPPTGGATERNVVQAGAVTRAKRERGLGRRGAEGAKAAGLGRWRPS
jgi:hypothetical protein